MRKQFGQFCLFTALTAAGWSGYENAATKTARTALKRFLVKSKTVNEGGIELTAEVRLTDAATSFVNRLHEIEGVGSVTLVSYNGEYMS